MQTNTNWKWENIIQTIFNFKTNEVLQIEKKFAILNARLK